MMMQAIQYYCATRTSLTVCNRRVPIKAEPSQQPGTVLLRSHIILASPSSLYAERLLWIVISHHLCTDMRYSFCFVFAAFSVSDVFAWWLIPQAINSGLFRGDGSACSLLPGLTHRQRAVCAKHPSNIHFVILGLNNAARECQNQFRDQKWNCSSTRRGFTLSQLKIASRETAYVFALSSGAVSHALARACSQGAIVDCGCAPRPRHSSKQFMWAGCSDNVQYANSFGRRFIDGADLSHLGDARSLMNLHNNRVGRKILANNLRRECKCHGVSGSCVTKTCWRVVPELEEFAALLKKKYLRAAKVNMVQEGKSVVLRVERNGARAGRYLREPRRSASRNELVFIDDSPDYCREDSLNEVFGPRGRECDDKCDSICCGRGYETIRRVVAESCRCKFVWCCEVKCATCRRIVDYNYCV